MIAKSAMGIQPIEHPSFLGLFCVFRHCFASVRDQEVAGSNPVTPIDANPGHAGVCLFMAGFGLRLTFTTFQGETSLQFLEGNAHGVAESADSMGHHSARGIPKIAFTKTRGIGWHVNYRDPLSRVPRKRSFGMVELNEGFRTLS